MGKVVLKTQKNKASVAAFLNAVEDADKRRDCKTIDKLMREVSGCKPVMWGDSLIGYDAYEYKYASGREGEWFMIGFSPRKQNITIYIMPGYQDFGTLLEKLGPYKKGRSCLYIKQLSDIHMPTLKKIIVKGYKDMKKMQKAKVA